MFKGRNHLEFYWRDPRVQVSSLLIARPNNYDTPILNLILLRTDAQSSIILKFGDGWAVRIFFVPYIVSLSRAREEHKLTASNRILTKKSVFNMSFSLKEYLNSQQKKFINHGHD